jgi:hypothetical protein
MKGGEVRGGLPPQAAGLAEGAQGLARLFLLGEETS